MVHLLSAPPDAAAIRAAWQSLTEGIDQATAAVHRPAGAVTLVAVSKNHPVATIEPLVQAGHRIFGENRVQEATEKWYELKQRTPDIQLHCIGPLQRNKVREAVAIFDVIETLDRPQLAVALSAEMQRQGRFLPCMVQVNIGQEPQKAGVAPDQTTDLVAHARDLGLKVTGLMCIPPVDHSPEPYFTRLRDLAHHAHVADLSMGMSADYATAIHYGATHVRIGSALFGARS